jgi:hypothetical protein
MKSGIGLYSSNRNEKRLLITDASKPYSESGGFCISSLSPLADFGKRLAGHCLPLMRKLANRNVLSYRTFEILSNVVGVWLVFQAHIRTFGLTGEGVAKEAMLQ